MKLIFIRHGEPDYSIDSLTPKGWREAGLLAERTKKWPVKKIYVSPLGRAKDTASFTEEALGMKGEIKDWMKEFYYPVIDPETGERRLPWDFMPRFFGPFDELHDRKGWMHTEMMQSADMDMHYKEVCEGLDEILAAHGYVSENGYYRVEEHNDDILVFFCHLGLSYVCLSHLIGVSPVVLWQGMFTAPTSVTILGSEEREAGFASFRTQVIGDTTHLHDGGEPISHMGYFTDPFQL